jgi:hypothetical protein
VGAKVLVEREEGSFGGGGWPIFRFSAGSSQLYSLRLIIIIYCGCINNLHMFLAKSLKIRTNKRRFIRIDRCRWTGN